MNNFWSKFENFIFDILGLVLPGFILLLLLVTPLLLFEFSAIPQAKLDSSILLSTLSILSKGIHQFLTLNVNILIGAVFILSYIIGHLVKVFSIIQYEFFVAVFDKTINKLIIYLYESSKCILNRLYNKVTSKDIYMTFIYKHIKISFDRIKNTLNKIFVFKPPNYFSDNEIMRTKCIEIINQKLNTNYPDKWYSLYKLSVVINTQENIRSLSGKFLAKYNLYRSLAFIFILISIYFSIFFHVSDDYLNPSILNLREIILMIFTLLWFTFHYKYKRYWTLCGNEVLVSLFYYLNKKNINSEA